jgi:hypothetical protein
MVAPLLLLQLLFPFLMNVMPMMMMMMMMNH